MRLNMRITPAFVAFVSPLLLAGCLIVPVPMPGPAPWQGEAAAPRGQCGAASVQRYIGQPVELLRFPEGTRIIMPGDAVTEDFNDARLNVDVEPTGLVTRIWCG